MTPRAEQQKHVEQTIAVLRDVGSSKEWLDAQLASDDVYGILSFDDWGEAEDYVCRVHGRTTLSDTIRIVRVEIREL